MRRILGLASLSIVALGCKPKQLTLAEEFERAACACQHRDDACARSARSTYDGEMPTVAHHWYERSIDAAEWQRHEQAARECAHRVSSCSADDPCGAGRFCAVVDPTTGVGACARWLAEGATCGQTLDACGTGTYCRISNEGFNDECGFVGCPGTCVKGSLADDPQSAALQLVAGQPASASASASASK